ncbi:hypothetical protein EYF80_003485 [Liparis tanakae]|uniref:Uncharacterized protein n=1 Tax=Liparis tanakae TaxID=230148 RepID=A0A4Z2J8N9_9TELE|nr:hypothetical protein EYF80_003485 [Liparis tanakae]
MMILSAQSLRKSDIFCFSWAFISCLAITFRYANSKPLAWARGHTTNDIMTNQSLLYPQPLQTTTTTVSRRQVASILKAQSWSLAESSLMEDRVRRNCSAEPSGTSGLASCASWIFCFSSSVGIIVRIF